MAAIMGAPAGRPKAGAAGRRPGPGPRAGSGAGGPHPVAALAAAVGAGAWAMAREQGAGPQMPVAERFSEMMDVGGAEATLEAKVATQTRRESGALNVGDADSFGRNVRWLGLMSSVPLALKRPLTKQESSGKPLRVETTKPMRAISD